MMSNHECGSSPPPPPPLTPSPPTPSPPTPSPPPPPPQILPTPPKKRKRDEIIIVTNPPYTREYLDSLTVEVLRNQILKKYNIRNGKNKSHTINLILERFTPKHQTIAQQTLNTIENTQHPSPSQITSHYKKHFNPIDRHDKWWYKHAYSYPIHKWRSKMVISLVDMALVNVFVLYNDFKPEKITKFRILLARDLMNE
jgi:hypothetical protein